jgi:D-amino-acid dehydrogenase
MSLPSRAEVAVVGGGVVGVATAWFLAKAGARPVLLERDAIASGSSGGNAGLVVPSHSLPMAAPGMIAKGLRWMFRPDSPFYIKFRFDPDLFRWLWRFRAACAPERAARAVPVLRDLHLASRALYEELAGPGGVDCGYARRGLLLLFRTPEGLEEGRHEAAQLAPHGIPARDLDPDACRALVPALRPGLAGGLHYPDDAHLDPGAFTLGLAERARALGAEIVPGCEVLGFERSGNRIDALQTSRGRLPVGQVVLAAGAWSPALARSLELRLPMEPGKGYSLTLDAPAAPPPLPLLCLEDRVAITPLPGALRLAGTLEFAGHDLAGNERRVDAVRRGARLYLDGLEALRERPAWRGLRPCTPDGLPYLGRPARWSNLVLCAGHAMVGLSLGPVSGRLAARLALGEPPDHDLALLHPDRPA